MVLAALLLSLDLLDNLLQNFLDTVHLNTPLRPAQTLDVQEPNLISKCKVHDIYLCAFMLAVLND